MSVIKRMRVSLVYIIETRVKIERVVKIKRRNSRSMAFQNLILIIMLEKKKKLLIQKVIPKSIAPGGNFFIIASYAAASKDKE
jgi:hypothetical protein